MLHAAVAPLLPVNLVQPQKHSHPPPLLRVRSVPAWLLLIFRFSTHMKSDLLLLLLNCASVSDISSGSKPSVWFLRMDYSLLSGAPTTRHPFFRLSDVYFNINSVYNKVFV